MIFIAKAIFVITKCICKIYIFNITIFFCILFHEFIIKRICLSIIIYKERNSYRFAPSQWWSTAVVALFYFKERLQLFDVAA